MLSRLFKSVTTLLLALLVGASLAPGSADAQSPSANGNPNIYFKPYPAPVLPPAGGSFVDPTFSTTIVRITDPSNAPQGASVNSASTDSMWNADGSMFYLLHNNIEWVLYAVNRTAGTVSRLR